MKARSEQMLKRSYRLSAATPFSLERYMASPCGRCHISVWGKPQTVRFHKEKNKNDNYDNHIWT